MCNEVVKKFTRFIIYICLFTILFVFQKTVWASVTPPISPIYITITNNPLGQPNTIAITDPNIMANDVINVYKTNTDANAIDTFIVTDPNNAVFFTYSFGPSVSTIYISRISLYSLESTRTALTLSIAADPNYIGFSAANISAVINRIDMPSEVDLTGILIGDIIRVYNAQAGGAQIGVGISSSTSVKIYIPDLGSAASAVYVTRQTPSNTESQRFAKSFAKQPPKIASVVAINGTGTVTSLEPNNTIIIAFDANTNKPTIDGNNINQFLRLYDPNGNRHSWGGDLNDANDSFTIPPDIAAAWNTAGNQLSITFNNDTSTVTLAIGDTTIINASANLTDAASATTASTAISPPILGAFVSTPVMLSAVAADTGNNLGLGCNDSVTITFSGPTNEPSFAANINAWLNPTSGLVTHVWATNTSSSIACSWNEDADVLTVTFRNNVGSTIKVGDILTLSTNAHLEDNGNTTPDSNCSVTLTGTFTSTPKITSIVASDDGNNLGLGVGDKIRVTFNQNTNKPAIDSNNLDSLFALNNGHSWGDDPNISTSWDVTGSVLTFTFNDVANSTIWIGDTITIDPNANIQDALATTAGTSASGTLTGSFSSVPKIVSVVAANGGNTPGLSLGDTVTITFNEPTNMMNDLLTPANINSWLKLSNNHSWGTGLDSNSIVWDANGDQLQIIFDSIAGSTITARDKLTIDANAGLKEPNSTTLSCTADCNMTGTFTWPPKILSIVASDNPNTLGLVAGSKIIITFDQNTNKPTVTSTNINSWFKLYTDPNDPNTRHSWGTNSKCVGTPTWDANGILLTVQFNNVTGSTITAGDTLVIDANAGLKDAALTTGASTNSSVITGGFTSSPAIISAVASNDANGFGLQPGDKVTITFNQNTNMPEIAPSDINSWLKLSSGHLWGGDLDGNNPDVNISWDPNGIILTIVFNSVAGSTITSLDTITIDADAGISNYNGTVPSCTSMATMSGAFTLAPQIVSAVAYNSGGNLGLGANDKVVITFDQPTNKDLNFKNNLGTALKLCLATNPNQVHVWGNATGNTINTISDANWDANGAVFTIIFNSSVSTFATPSTLVRANDTVWVNSTTLKDAGNTIAVSSNKVTITGTFTYPVAITSAVATSGNIVGSDANAIIQITFNQNTNKPEIQPNNIDNLLKLSYGHTWDTVSSTAWDANGIKLTITYGSSAVSPTISIGDIITIDASASIEDAYGTTNPCISSRMLIGAFNPSPSIISAVIANGPGTPSVLDVEDTVTITLNEPTNQAPIATGNIDNYLVLSRGDSWGTGLQDSDIVWSDPSTLIITFSDVTNTTITPGDTITIYPGANITDALGTTSPSTASVVSTGSF